MRLSSSLRPLRSLPFQFTHPGRGATYRFNPFRLLAYQFQFTHPGRGATSTLVVRSSLIAVSIHAPREGCDLYTLYSCYLCDRFQFTHPGRGATSNCYTKSADPPVSIHAPREGCDVAQLLHLFKPRRVSIHAPREGCDSWSKPPCERMRRFQFTHPGRGATYCTPLSVSLALCFNSRTPGGVRPAHSTLTATILKFQFTHPGRGATMATLTDSLRREVSIHAPREGCDANARRMAKIVSIVSIHAPREGCDSSLSIAHAISLSFNSRTPGGVRPATTANTASKATFQFTHPGRGATRRYCGTPCRGLVSIHAPREGCDCSYPSCRRRS